MSFYSVLLLPCLCTFLLLGRSHSHSHSSSIHGQAERFIRALNLIPDGQREGEREREEGIVGGWEVTAPGGPRLVERPIRLDVKGDPGTTISPEELGHSAGYFKLNNTHDTRLFYLFFESRGKKATDPLVLWMSGGPGCSSELAVFYENGPYKMLDNMTLVWNDYGWDKVSNIIFVDQPVGTGFSYSNDIRDIRHDENGVSEDVYNFLEAFLDAHPKLRKNEFYVTGESYAGHYVPAVTSRIHDANKAGEGSRINLKGFAIGNGLTNPEIQYQAYADYALNMGLIKEDDHTRIAKLYPPCALSIKLCGTKGTLSCAISYMICNSIFNSIMSLVGNINYYDIRKECLGSLCYDFSAMETYLNEPSVKSALGVGDQKFVSCSTTVYEVMIIDWMRNLEAGIPNLLEDGVKVLIYAGEYDLICNWLGNSRWVSEIDWSGKEKYAKTSPKPFMVDGKEAGEFTSSGVLNFMKVHDAGHMVPMDQPAASLEMLRCFIQGKSFDATSDVLEMASPDDQLTSVFSV